MNQPHEFCAAILKGLAQPNRLKIIATLRDGERCEADIVFEIGEKQPNTSRHLTALFEAGLISMRRDGPRVFYSIRYPEVVNLVDLAMKIVAHEIGAYHHLAWFRKKP